MKIFISIWVFSGLLSFVYFTLKIGLLKLKDLVLLPFVVILGPLPLTLELVDNMEMVIWRRK